jgi:hypothetical protein
MEALWVDNGPLSSEMRDFKLAHPLAQSAESLYTYSIGDSLSIQLPDKRVVRVTELRVRPKKESPALIVGSFWFDNASGQVVRAAYRPGAPRDLFVSVDSDSLLQAAADSVAARKNSALGTAITKALVSPLKAEISEVVVEYALYEQRFWLPRFRSMDAGGQMSFLKGWVRVEHRFEYSNVNIRDSLPAVVVMSIPVHKDSVNEKERNDVVAGLRPDSVGQCDSTGHYLVTKKSEEGAIPIALLVPCDRSALAKSPALPRSLFDQVDSDAVERERRRLIDDALSLGAQPPADVKSLFDKPLLPSLGYGINWMRFNRVEGFSVGLEVNRGIGGGYSVRPIGRFGFADRIPNVELQVARTTSTDSVFVAGYRRLISANDWGAPLSFLSSIPAALFGKDDGFYYRATGGELGGGRTMAFARGANVNWRLFAEHQESAPVKLSSALLGPDFRPNVDALRGDYYGGSLRAVRTFGLDPSRSSILADVRLEAATGTTDYGRAAFDLTFTQPIGKFAVGLTTAAGSSIGTLPPQRYWFLGGTQTIRGQRADVAHSGNSFWFTRSELAIQNSIQRTSVFFDAGWAGDRNRISEVGRPLTGVGFGQSYLNGFVRYDVARGLYPDRKWRFDLYLGARF